MDGTFKCCVISVDGTFKCCVSREIGDDCGLPGLSLKTKQSGNLTLRTTYI